MCQEIKSGRMRRVMMTRENQLVEALPPFLFKAECGHSCHRDLSAVHGSSSNSQGFLSLVRGRRHGCYRLGRKGTPAPSTLLEQAFEILPSGYHQGLTVDPPEPSKGKPPHPMPLLAFTKERFDPH